MGKEGLSGAWGHGGQGSNTWWEGTSLPEEATFIKDKPRESYSPSDRPQQSWEPPKLQCMGAGAYSIHSSDMQGQLASFMAEIHTAEATEFLVT